MEKFNNILKYYTVPELDLVSLNNKPKFQNIVLISKNVLDDQTHMEFLSKILASVKLVQNENTSLIELNEGTYFPLKELSEENKLDIIAFGIKPSQLMLNGFEELHKTYTINHLRILFALAVPMYNGQDVQKKMLWLALKSLKNMS